MNFEIVCRSCQRRCDKSDFRCPSCGGILDCIFSMDDRTHYRDVIVNAQKFWDYKDLLPVHATNMVTLGEGFSPIINACHLADELGIRNIFIKNEGQNPSGTFKDRCMSVSYTKALEMNVEATAIGSAGNAGAAAAAYAAAANIPCFVILPACTPMERIVQTLRYGAQVITARGNVSDCIDLLEKLCQERGWLNMTTAHSCNPYQAEGTKTIAYEMAKDLDWEVPDWILIPIGGGGILSGVYKGWCEMKQLGLIDRIPRFVGVQEDGCAAVVEAYLSNSHPCEIERVKNPTGVAVAIQDAFPLDGGTALEAIYSSHGTATKVTADEIAHAQGLLGATTGIYAEPAGVCPVAALVKLKSSGTIREDENVACIVTGNGLKDNAFAIANATPPPVIDLDEKALRELIDSFIL